MRLGPLSHRARRGLAGAREYGRTHIEERHRHRYEVANEYRKLLEKNGFRVSGRVAGEAAGGDRRAARPPLVRRRPVPPRVPVAALGAAPPLRRLRRSGPAPRSPVRQRRPPPRRDCASWRARESRRPRRPAAAVRRCSRSALRARRPRAKSDPALRQRFLAEYRERPAETAGARCSRPGSRGSASPGCSTRWRADSRVATTTPTSWARRPTRSTRDMPAVLQACQTRCVSGCMHGVLMEAFTERPGSLRERIATCATGMPSARSTRRATASTGSATARPTCRTTTSRGLWRFARRSGNAPTSTTARPGRTCRCS